jgi:dimethylsulfone monooxygenase
MVGRQNNPLFRHNKLKMAVFGANVSHGCSMTFVDGTIKVDWSESVRIAQAAERAGFDAIIPVARWRGLGGEINFNHRCFETYTWAAGLASGRPISRSLWRISIICRRIANREGLDGGERRI